jgi:hypothetical protein
MALPAIVAVAGGDEALDGVEAQLGERYAQHYRIECVRDPGGGLALLEAPNAWTDTGTADAIRTAMALGRVDHFVREPGRRPTRSSTRPSAASCSSGRVSGIAFPDGPDRR